MMTLIFGICPIIQVLAQQTSPKNDSVRLDQGIQSKISLKNLTERASYMMGTDIASQIKRMKTEVDVDAFVQGLGDVWNNRSLLLPKATLDSIRSIFAMQLREQQKSDDSDRQFFATHPLSEQQKIKARETNTNTPPVFETGTNYYENGIIALQVTPGPNGYQDRTDEKWYTPKGNLYYWYRTKDMIAYIDVFWPNSKIKRFTQRIGFPSGITIECACYDKRGNIIPCVGEIAVEPPSGPAGKDFGRLLFDCH
jgi:hypothetical protein